VINNSQQNKIQISGQSVVTRAPAGRCKVVHLHPLDFAFQFFFQNTIYISVNRVWHRDTVKLFSKSEIQQQVLMFHKQTLYTDYAFNHSLTVL